MHDTVRLLQHSDFPALQRAATTTLQVNLGYKCNQSCVHCHVAASPKRTEMMSDDTVDLLLSVLGTGRFATVDVTGGAPELHERFRDVVVAARALGIEVIDRCNLTILTEPGQETTAEFLAEHQVQVVASLPCYLGENVDAQRGKGVFADSLTGLQQLNALGYGHAGSGLILNLVFNPQGPTLPPGQAELTHAYRVELADRFGVVFNDLFVLANMPIKRFGATLVSKGQFAEYMNLLRDNHSDSNLAAVMCRTTISVDWQGNLFDCDFNQMLGLPTPTSTRHLSDLLTADVAGDPIRVAGHCYGCTAGQGSSCGGALDGSGT